MPVSVATSTIAWFQVTSHLSLATPVYHSVVFAAASRSLAVCTLNRVDLNANFVLLLSLTLHGR